MSKLSLNNSLRAGALFAAVASTSACVSPYEQRGPVDPRLAREQAQGTATVVGGLACGALAEAVNGSGFGQVLSAASCTYGVREAAGASAEARAAAQGYAVRSAVTGQIVDGYRVERFPY